MMKKIFLIYILLLIPHFLFSQCFKSLQFGGLHTVGQKLDGSWWGWGHNYDGALLQEDRLKIEASPIQLINTDNDWSRVFLGKHRTFVIKRDGTLWGAGANGWGELGVNSYDTYYTTLQSITTANNWIKVSVGPHHTLALKSDGTLWGWGRNDSYQLGFPPSSSYPSQRYPVQIGMDTDWVDIETGLGVPTPSFAIKSDGTIWGWGVNSENIFVLDPLTTIVTEPMQLGTDTDWIGLV